MGREKVTQEKLKKYFDITKKAFEKAKKADSERIEEKKEILEMVKNYISDAEHFEKKGDIVNAFAALSYAHGWLDCGARLKIFHVIDSRLFTVD
ncbi:DUF357 domain-containing protein [Candidatus Woesearchaeota archaeon]|nr:DUF357 domain-containing protein [Candidatus Woesearchaeota archaeon]